MSDRPSAIFRPQNTSRLLRHAIQIIKINVDHLDVHFLNIVHVAAVFHAIVEYVLEYYIILLICLFTTLLGLGLPLLQYIQYHYRYHEKEAGDGEDHGHCVPGEVLQIC